MIRVLQQQRTVYRSEVGRRGRLTQRAAYLDAAWQAWRAKYPCECEHEVGLVCDQHRRDYKVNAEGDNVGPPELDSEMVDHRRKTIVRLARWLKWRDSLPAPVANDAPPLFKVGEPVSFQHRDRVVFGVITGMHKAHVGHGVRVAEAITNYADQRLWFVTSWIVGEANLTRLAPEKKR